jgi:hypothetical protein
MKGFISYSHLDHVSLNSFRTHIKAVERAFATDFWADTRIKPGFYWNRSIEIAIEDADVFLLLVSPGFIASDYIYDHEIPAIKARHRVGALVIPVVLKRCMWQLVASALQALPMHEGRIKPIIDWKPHEAGFDTARGQIGEAIKSYFGISPLAIDWASP